MVRVVTTLPTPPNTNFSVPSHPPSYPPTLPPSHLLVQVFYLFAIAAINLFRDNDPWHFNSIPIAFVTLFRVATLEDWTDVMYINMYGCDKYQSIYVSTDAAVASATADIMYWCEHPKAMPTVSAVFWVVFVLISAFIMLSLFIGAVTVSMGEMMEEVRREKEETKKKVRRRHRAASPCV